MYVYCGNERVCEILWELFFLWVIIFVINLVMYRDYNFFNIVYYIIWLFMLFIKCSMIERSKILNMFFVGVKWVNNDIKKVL